MGGRARGAAATAAGPVAVSMVEGAGGRVKKGGMRGRVGGAGAGREGGERRRQRRSCRRAVVEVWGGRE